MAPLVRRTWAPRGQTPDLDQCGTRQKVSVAAALWLSPRRERLGLYFQTLPDGYFDNSVVPYSQWRQFHSWQLTPSESKGVVVYLRSLTPEPQAGTRGNFGIRRLDGAAAASSGPAVDAASTD